MDTEFTGIDWERTLSALSIPAAIFDREGQLVYANDSLSHELFPKLALYGRVSGGSALAKHHALVIESRTAALFADARYLWAMIPVCDRHGRLREVLLTGFGASTFRDGPKGRQEARARITGTMQAQLAAIAGLAGSLQNTITGEGRDQAELIEQSSRLVLRELKSLTGSNGE